MSVEVTATPATMPSTTATKARPWDSPAVIQRNTRLFSHVGARLIASTASRSPLAPGSLALFRAAVDLDAVGHTRPSPTATAVATHIDGPCGTVDAPVPARTPSPS